METDQKQPYFAVIFTSVISENITGYEEMSIQMVEIARKQKGFLGIDSARQGVGITISYWESLEDISNWKNNSEHILAQNEGKEKWYKFYTVRVVKVLRDYEFNKL